jgi:Zn-dependent metalloprotease
MNFKLLPLLSLWLLVVGIAQAHTTFNKNISPFNDAQEALHGQTAVQLTKQAAWQNFVAKYPGWGARFDPHTQLPHRAFGPAIAYTGGGMDAVQKAKHFIENELRGFNLSTEELIITNFRNDGKYIHVDFKQQHAGKDVLWSRTTVRFTQDLRIVLFGTDFYRNFPQAGSLIDAAQAKVYAETALQTTVLSSEVSANTKWFPYPTSKGATMKLVYEVLVHTQDDEVTPGAYLTYVDAETGEVIYRHNKVDQLGFQVTGGTYAINLQSPITTVGLPNLKVTVGSSTYYTDNNGQVVLPTAGPWNPLISLEGKFSKVVTGASGNTSALSSPTGLVDADVHNFPTTITNSSERHVNAYYHVNVVHDFMKSKFPAFTVMDNPLTTRVDRTDGNCNAFYNGSSINFYTTGSGCNALSYVADVIYHEYGHGISDKFWDDNGSSFDNGGMGEGYSDVWAMCLIKNPIIGKGMMVGNPNSFIRRYDQAPKVYPQDITGEVHDDGEIIAGAWWDVALNLAATQSLPLSQAIDSMGDIFAGSQFGLATGPDGTEGKVYFDILIDALQYDDNNSNLNDGTPHFLDIVKAFGKHGIFLLSDSKITSQSGYMQPANQAFPVVADLTASFPAFVGDVKMFYRSKGTTTIDSLTLTMQPDSSYTANFPSTAAGDIIEYYLIVEDILDNTSAFEPVNASFYTSFIQRNIPLYFAVGYIPKYSEHLENTLTDWIIGDYPGDNASAGKWIVNFPISSVINGDTCQTGRDHTSGTGKCAITGNAASASSQAGSADIDNGKTSLRTQEFDLSTYTKPVISYYRWFSNSQSTTSAGRKDRWIVYLIYPNSSYLIERTYQPDVSWRQNLIPVDLAIGNKVRVLFIAEDSIQNGSGTIVEAGIDDIEILDLGAFPASVADHENPMVRIYPNPTTDQVTLSNLNRGAVEITVRNAVGAIVYAGVKAVGVTETTLDTRAWMNGLYLVEVSDKDGRSTVKLTVSH